MSKVMSKANVKPIPDGTHSLTAHIVCEHAFEAMEFYKKAFNAVEEMRLPGPDGKLMHGCVRIGDQTHADRRESRLGRVRPESIERIACHNSPYR